MERRLGKGLGSLLQTESVEGLALELDIADITPNPFQPRKSIDPVALEELRDSVQTHGILQPVVVRRQAGRFQLISGERRWRAARLAGLARVPAVVRENVSDGQMLELALVENLQRRDLNPIERAQGFKDLMDRLGLTQDGVASKIGLKRPTVANHLRLLDLPDRVRDAVAKGVVSMGHAKAFLGASSPARIPELLERTVRKELSVREVEQLVREDGVAGARPAKPAPERPPWVAAIERRLRDALATKVSLESSPAYRGRIQIDFYSRSDLERVLEQIAPSAKL